MTDHKAHQANPPFARLDSADSRAQSLLDQNDCHNTDILRESELHVS